MIGLKKRNKVVFFIVLLSGISLLFSGCGGGRSLSSSRLASQEIRINKKSYLPLSSVCKYYDFSWEWDGFSRIINLKKDGLSVKLYPGSPLILYNDRVMDLKAPVELYRGVMMVPASFADLFLLSREKAPPPQERRKTAYTIKKVVIDPGHGGKDPGATGIGGLKEKDVNLDIAKRLAAELKRKGLEVVLTRDTDVFYSLYKRSDIANESNADFFICIHANAAESSSAYGFEAFYLSPDYDDFSKAVQIRENAAVKFEKESEYKYSQDLNAILWDMLLSENRIESMEMAYSISGELKRLLKLKTRFVHGAMFYVLKGTRIPAVLLEVGYVTNPAEAARLNNPYYRQMLAEAIASGILNYKKTYEANNGFSD